MGGPVRRFFASSGFARGLGAVGRFMITSGVVILLLVAYELWGTNLQTDRAQQSLAEEFEQQVRQVSATSSATTPSTLVGDDPLVTPPPETTPGAVAPSIPPPAEGTPIGRISIPAIGLRNFFFVEGTGVDQLKRGAAHYPLTPLPGQKGNAAIAGHRTTYGAPFHNIDKLQKGDEVTVETLQGTFTYEVIEQRIVKPTDVSVLDDVGDNRITLTACHPKFSARERIIVFATLKGTPVPPLVGQQEAAREVAGVVAGTDGSIRTIDEFATEPVVRLPGAGWGVVAVALWISTRLLAWWGHRSRRFPRVLAYLIGTPVCLLLLYLFFESFSYEAFARAVNLSV